MYLPGIIKGKQIELIHPTGLPEGMTILVKIQLVKPTYQEQQTLVDELCGVWENDSNLANIFAELDQQRHQSVSREITFDLSS
jgi:hypothetical protein